MANVYATKNGVWSHTTVWDTGSLPTGGTVTAIQSTLQEYITTKKF